VSAAWEEVYVGQYRRLVALLTVVTGSVPEAEEAVQEAFVRALGLTGKRAVVDDPEAWLYRVATNHVRSRWRKMATARRHANDLPPGDPGIASPSRSDDRMVLVNALRRLPVTQREVLALHYIADLSVAAIAARVEAPIGTVKARLSRGREALKALLSAELALDGDRGA
jgi:RNA polymerase sigma-70 factor (ECF subfamily)